MTELTLSPRDTILDEAKYTSCFVTDIDVWHRSAAQVKSTQHGQTVTH